MSSHVPRIIYGTAWKKDATTDLVVKAVLNGFRAIDTACQPKHYREELVGRALSELEKTHGISRSSLYVQTKFTSLDGQDLTKPIPYDADAKVEDQVDQSIATSLRQLGVDYIDCLVMHSPMRTKEQTLRAYRQLEQYHDRGTLKSLGISNIYSPSLLKWLIAESRVKLSVVQNRWHEGNQWDWEVFDICRQNGIMYQSFWTLSGNPTLLAHPMLKKLADKYGLTPEQALYKFCSMIGITPLSGTTSDTHMKQDIAVINGRDFEASEVEAILSMMKQNGNSVGAPSKRTRRAKIHPAPEDTLLSLPEDKSMRNLLLGNISEQHALATKLFEALSQSLSASRRVNTSSTALLSEVTDMYTRMETLTEEHAQLVELARKHRDRWERLQRKRLRKQALEDKVRRVLVQLQEGRREIEEIVDEGEGILRGIEMASKAAIPIDTLINHATRLAPYTTRTAAAEPSRAASLPTQEVYYPLERLMMGSKLMRLARGELIGAGEIGDKEVVGDDTQMLDTATVSEAQAGAETIRSSEPIRTQSTPQQPIKPIKLDMLESDSEDDNDDMN